MTTVVESGSSQNAGLMNTISQKKKEKKHMTANETRSQASSQEAQIFYFPLGRGREGGREGGLKVKC